MVKKTLLYIGHPYHLRSKSVDFLKTRLEREFDIDYVETNLDCTFPYDRIAMIPREKYDVCVCLQVMPSMVEIRKRVKFEYGVFFPMADYYYGITSADMPIWREYADFRIISFSRKLHDELKARGFDVEYIQYFPKPAEVKDWGDERGIWFWQRITHLNVYTLLSVLKGYPLRRLHIHKIVDPGEQFVLLPTPYQRGFGVSYSVWYETRAEMQRDMERYALYFAPRPIEGIGLSYLEAMAHGRCVIAHDDTCANEYIQHGENGFLYDFRRPEKTAIDLKPEDVRRIQQNALAYVRSGHEKWQQTLEHLSDLFFRPLRADKRLLEANEAVWSKKAKLTCPALQDPTACLRAASPCGHKTLRSRWTNFKQLCSNADNVGSYRVDRRKKILGIPLFSKDVRSDGRRVKFRFFGLPLIVVDFI